MRSFFLKAVIMRKPDEGLDDYIVGPEHEKPAGPPLAVRLEPTGDIEILKPLATLDKRVNASQPMPGMTAARRNPYRLSWFHRSLAVGAAALMIAMVFISAIVIGVSEHTTELVQAPPNTRPVDILADTNEPFSFDVYTPESEMDLSDPALRIPVRVSRTLARARIRRKSVKLRTRANELDQPRFSPTTLVIYAENGEIKTRIEPQLSARNMKPPTLN